MKDLDFDELDKAVNSLMADASKKSDSQVPATTTATTQPSTQPTATLPGAPSVGMKPSSVKPMPTLSVPSRSRAQNTSSMSSSAISPTLSVAARRSGKFMDVVPPSAQKPALSPRPMSREGMKLDPMVTSTSRTTTSSPTPSLMPKPETNKLDTKPQSSSTSSEWPDPLDVANFKDKGSEPASLESPFLPDAKVEKRPLGGNDSSDAAPLLAAKPEMAPAPVTLTPDEDKDGKDSLAGSEDPKDQLIEATPAEVESQLPEELRGDLMEVEADTHMGVPKTDDVTPRDREMVKAQKPLKPSKPAMTSPKESSTPLSNGPTSISQQYKEEPSTGDQVSGAIFDTATYHQPLSHPVKKKSGWLWVIGIIIVLLVGAAGGAALYFLNIV